MNNSQATVEVPSEAMTIPVNSQSQISANVHLTLGTMVMSFEKVRNLLSGKPLRKPNRREPLPR